MTRKLPFVRQKYIDILKAQGVSAAITALHKDQNEFEFQTFEGQDGYQPDAFVELADVHTFSRELWEMSRTGVIPKA